MPGEDLSRSYPVSRYLESIKRLVTTKVPPVWVHGVISQLQVRDHWCFLTLSEYSPSDVRPIATLNLFLFRSHLDALHARLDKLAQPFRLAVELKVSLLVEADFYVAQGKFQARITDIDPRHTLGELALTRQAILERLRKENLLERNRQLPSPQIPLRLGLITAQDSAASQDFLQTLHSSPFAFKVSVMWARMQGNSMEEDILQALGKLRLQTELDALCIVRGGGSRSDLVYFDSEALCRAVAQFPVPVYTGIGHEIDSALIDLVAHRSCITPTDCAGHLVGLVDEAWRRTCSCAGDIGAAVLLRLGTASTQLLKVGQCFGQFLPRRINREKEKHAFLLRGLQRGPQKILALRKAGFRSVAHRILLTWKYRGVHEQRKNKDLGSQLVRFTRNIIKQQDAKLQQLEMLCKARDPVQVLARGYALVRNSQGRILRGWADLGDDQQVQVQLRDGVRTLRNS